jgi:hypothetical protein
MGSFWLRISIAGTVHVNASFGQIIKQRISSLAKRLLASQEEFCAMQSITVKLADIDTRSVNVNSDINHDRKFQIVGT